MTTWLVADIGATHLRAAVCPAGAAAPGAVTTLRCADFPRLEDALAACIAAAGAAPAAACLAVAGPVAGDAFSFTNSPWRFSRDALARRLGLARLAVVNDFAALARALPALGAADLAGIGGGVAAARAARAVLGPGSGLGMAILAPQPAQAGGWVVLAGEGGHAGFAPGDPFEDELARVLRARHGRLCNESLLSGPGLERLYAAVAAVEGRPARPLAAAEVSALALAGTDAAARRALGVFFAVLGSVAGDLALVAGARGGVYVGGGIVPRMVDALRASDFRRRFEDKGAMRDYVAAIPTAAIVAPHPALVGALALLAETPA
ncbi:MAG: glucokinase [Burkholderiales bacterium]|nr:glucokinase [Burkholderiales bacterium]